ncbi:hemerythrin domain-containing protein [Noviherbaspirillum sp. Root189]|uniref:hemerythrin domain-containing protein n=1 Tax=Noviherbaspirillum sp. Root189 TaxID=1736487 RepID=UPI0009EC1DEA|nr:hemerythrin domain-containing protein [Noviherbaspirillum sp. Root189]
MRLRSSHASVRSIQADHDLLNAVIQAMVHIVRAIDKGGKAPDLKVFRAMLFYIREYPEKMHHPKEDYLLFPLVRKRTHEVDQAIAELEAQHTLGDRLVLQLEHALARYELEGKPAFEPFYLMVEQYAGFYSAHMRLEEDKILTTAMEVLTDEDWKKLDAAFTNHEDPLIGSQYKESMEKLFSLIVNLAPSPIGVGPAL